MKKKHNLKMFEGFKIKISDYDGRTIAKFQDVDADKLEFKLQEIFKKLK